MIKNVFDRVENIVVKGENAGNQHFLLFPQCFQKLYFPVLLKPVIVWEIVNQQNAPLLTLYHTILTFNDPREGFGKHREKVTSIFSFSRNVFIPIKDRNYHFCNV